MTVIQPMPDLSPDERAALRDDIAARGIQLPIVRDQHGRILDGHNRVEIADELGITDVPTEVRHVGDDAEAWDIAETLNLARRHLSQDQKRDLLRRALRRRWSDSDRAIARRVGCSPSTVGSVRAELRDEAEARVQEAHDHLEKARDQIVVQAMMMHRGIESRPMPWQSVGDILERSVFGQLSNLDSDEAGRHVMELYGGWFDSIRGFALDCDPDCPTCVPMDREWAERHPRQVWRHSDVSNLDTEIGGSR